MRRHLLLRYRDGNDIALEEALSEKDLTVMESPDISEDAWDGWDSTLKHFTISWDQPNRKPKLICDDKTSLDELRESLKSYEEVYEVFNVKQRRYMPEPKELSERWGSKLENIAS